MPYPPDFELFWRAYGPVPNSSKSDGAKAYGQVIKELPPLSDLLHCVAAYRNWLRGENDIRISRRQPKYPQCHAASWLRAHKWESWLEGIAPQLTPEQIAVNKDRADFLFGRGKYSLIPLARFKD